MPSKYKPFSERVSSARTRRLQSRPVVVDEDAEAAARAALVDDYFKDPEPSPSSAGAWNPFSFSGLKSDLSDLGSKASSLFKPITRMITDPADAFSSARWQKAGEQVAAERAAQNEEFWNSRTGNVLTGAQRLAKSVRGQARQIGKPVVETAGQFGKAVLPGATGEEAAAAIDAQRALGQGYRGMVSGLAETATEDPLQLADPGFSMIPRSSNPWRTVGGVGAVVGSVVAGTPALRRLVGGAAKGATKAGLRGAFNISDAIEQGAAQRAAAEAAASRTAGTAFTPDFSNIGPIPVGEHATAFRGVGFQPPSWGPAHVPAQPTGRLITPEWDPKTPITHLPRVDAPPAPPPRVGPERQLPPIGGTTPPRTGRMFAPPAGIQRPGDFISHPDLGVAAPGQGPLGVVEIGPQGLSMNRLGDVSAPPTPGLGTMTPEGKIVRPKVTTTKTLAQMVEAYGPEEAAARAGMDVKELPKYLREEKRAAKAKVAREKEITAINNASTEELKAMAAAGNVRAANALAARVPAKKTTPKQKAIPKVQDLAEQLEASLVRDKARSTAPVPAAPSETVPAPLQREMPPPKPRVRQFANSPMETLEAMARKGNKYAIEELEFRAASGAPQPTRSLARMSDDAVADLAAADDPDAIAELAKRREKFEKGFQARQKKGRLSNETGSIGRDIGPLIEAEESGARGLVPRYRDRLRGWAFDTEPVAKPPGPAPKLGSLSQLLEDETGAINFRKMKDEDFHEMWRRMKAAPSNPVGEGFARGLIRQHGTGKPGWDRGPLDGDDTYITYRDQQGRPLVAVNLIKEKGGRWSVSDFGVDPERKGSMALGVAMNKVSKYMHDDLGVRGAYGSISSDTRNYITKLVTRGTGKTPEELDAIVANMDPDRQVMRVSDEADANWAARLEAEGVHPSQIELVRERASDMGLDWTDYRTPEDLDQFATPPQGPPLRGQQVINAGDRLRAQFRGTQGPPGRNVGGRLREAADRLRENLRIEGEARNRALIRENQRAARARARASGENPNLYGSEELVFMEDAQKQGLDRSVAQQMVTAARERGIQITDNTTIADLATRIAEFDNPNVVRDVSYTEDPRTPRAASERPPEPEPSQEQSWDYERWLDQQERQRAEVDERIAHVDEMKRRQDEMQRNRNRPPESQLGDVGAETEQGSAGGRRRSLLEDEGGFITTDLLKKGGRGLVSAVNQARLASMLSGWALPKSVAGNIGSFGIGAIEDIAAGKYGQAGRGIKEALRLPTNVKNAYAELFNPNSNYAGTRASWINLPGKAMGALDEASTMAHMRAGRTRQEAQRLLLQDPRYGMKGMGYKVGSGANAKNITEPVVDYLIPFRRTPFNVIGAGAKTMRTNKALSTAAIGAGAAFGGGISDDPRAVGLAAALFGPYTLPFLIGAASTTKGRAAWGLSPIPEWSLTKSIMDPLSPFQAPSFTKMWDEPGKQKTPPHRGTNRNKKTTTKKRGAR